MEGLDIEKLIAIAVALLEEQEDVKIEYKIARKEDKDEATA